MFRPTNHIFLFRSLNLTEDYLFPNDEIYHLNSEISSEELQCNDPLVAQLSSHGEQFLWELFRRISEDKLHCTAEAVGRMFEVLSLRDENNGSTIAAESANNGGDNNNNNNNNNSKQDQKSAASSASSSPSFRPIKCPFDVDAIARGAVVPLVDRDRRLLDFPGFLALWNSLFRNTISSTIEAIRCASYLGFWHQDKNTPFVKWCLKSERKSRHLFHTLVVGQDFPLRRAVVQQLTGVEAGGENVSVGRLHDYDVGAQQQPQQQLQQSQQLQQQKFVRVDATYDDASFLTLVEAAHFDCLILAFDDSIESVQFCERSLVKLKAHRDLAKTLPVLFLHIPSQPELSKSPVQGEYFFFLCSFVFPF